MQQYFVLPELVNILKVGGECRINIYMHTCPVMWLKLVVNTSRWLRLCRVNLHLLTSYFAIATENLPVIDCNISPAHEIKLTLTWPSAPSNKYISRLTAINGSWDRRDTDFGKHSRVIRIWVAWECHLNVLNKNIYFGI